MNHTNKALFLYLLLALTACSSNEVQSSKSLDEPKADLPVSVSNSDINVSKDMPAEEILARAEKSLKRERYDDAIVYLHTFISRFPLVPAAVDARLKIADAYFDSDRYIEATTSYQDFRQKHPTHADTDRILFQIGRAYYLQIPEEANRDLSLSQQALSYLQTHRNQYPNSPYKGSVEQHIHEVRKRLAERELIIGRYYVGQKRYKASIPRLENLLTQYTDLGFDDAALYYLGYAHYRMDNREKSTQVWKTLLDRFPDSPYNSDITKDFKAKNSWMTSLKNLLKNPN